MDGLLKVVVSMEMKAKVIYNGTEYEVTIIEMGIKLCLVRVPGIGDRKVKIEDLIF